MGNRRLIPLVLFLIIGTCAAHSRASSRRGLAGINYGPSSSEAYDDAVTWKASGREPSMASRGDSVAPYASAEENQHASNAWAPNEFHSGEANAPQMTNRNTAGPTARTIHTGPAQRRSRNSGLAAADGSATSATFRMASSSDVTIRHHNSPGSGKWTVREQGTSGRNGGAGRRVPTSGRAQGGALHATRGRAQRHPSRGASSHQLQRNERPQQQHVGFRMATAKDVALTRHAARSDDDSSLALAEESNYGMNRGGANYYNDDEEYRGSDRDAGDDNNENGSDNSGPGGDGRLDVNCDGGDASNGGGDASNGDGSGSSGGVDAAAILEVHNRARQEAGVPDLAWDDGVAAVAQDWANQLAGRGCPMEHGGAEGLGQNLYWRTPAGLTPEEDRMAVQAWVDEKADWTPSPIPEGCAEGKMCGHYTQVVWRDTTHVGCGSAQCPDGSGMWVCDYSPPGNFVGSMPF